MAHLPYDFGVSVGSRPPAQVFEPEAIRLPVGTTVSDAEKALIQLTLQHTKNNKTRAAEILGISLKTLFNKLKEYGASEASLMCPHNEFSGSCYADVSCLNDCSAELKRTPLFEVHSSSNAKMVDFGGWNMPVQYSSILEEHNAVRNSVGVFDVSHMGEIEVQGPSRQRSLSIMFRRITPRG